MLYFGEKLKTLREDKKLSQMEFGKRIGVSGSTVSAYEKSRKYPTLETFIKICSVLNVSSDYMLGLSDSMGLKKSDLTDNQISSLRTIIHDLEQYNLSKDIL